MKSLAIILSSLCCACALTEASPQSVDFSSFSVQVKDFTAKVYGEKISEYMLHSTDEAFAPEATPFQKIVRQYENNGKTVILRCGDFSSQTSTGADIKKYLGDTRFLNLTSPEVKNLARRFVAGKNQAVEVERFVSEFIDRKTLGIPLLPAVNVIRSRSGDCTEHTVLTVALLRSLGIPARAVMGMILVPEFGGRRNIFAYHMWAEAFYDGRWHLMDATRPGEKNHNRYIAFAFHSLASEMPLSYFRVIAAIQNLEVRYLKGK